MTKLEAVGEEGTPVSRFGNLSPDAGEVTTAAKETTASEAREPQMRALRRILGDVVLDVFPPELRDAVDKCYQFWIEHPDSYINTQFDTAEDLADSLAVMRAYAECAGEIGYTIRTLAKPDPTLLTWRAQNRRTVKPKE